MKIACERTIDAPVSAVWAVLVDLDSAADNIRAIEKLERIEGPAFGVGTTWVETRTMFGKQATETMWVTEVNEPHGYVVEAESNGVHYRSEYVLTATESGTHVEFGFGGEPTSPFARFMSATLGRLFAGATRRQLLADLDDIARIAEQG